MRLLFIFLLGLCFSVELQAAQQQSKEAVAAESVPRPPHQGGTEDQASQMAAHQEGFQYHAFGVGLGQTFLVGNWDNKRDKISADILYNYQASHTFGVLINYHSSRHKFKENQTIVEGVAVGLKGKAFEFDDFGPVLLGGVGFYWPKVNESKKEITFGLHFGAGVELRLNQHLNMGLLAHYHDPFSINQEEGPSVDGAYFKFMLTTFYIL